MFMIKNPHADDDAGQRNASKDPQNKQIQLHHA